MEPGRDALVSLLEKVFDEMRGSQKKTLGAKGYHAQREDFVFHMTDWLRDLDTLNRILRRPKECDVRQSTMDLVSTLYHILPHLNEAGRLLLDKVPNAFEVERKEGTGK